MDGDVAVRASRLLAKSYAHSGDVKGLTLASVSSLTADLTHLGEKIGTPDLEGAIRTLGARNRVPERTRSQSRSHRSRADLKWAAQWISPSHPADVVEFGAGSPEDVAYYSEQFSTAKYVGVDTRLSGWSSSDGRTVTASSLGNLEGSQKFQLGLIRYTLHHLEQVEQLAVLKNLASVLEPGAMIYIVEDAFEPLGLPSGGCEVCHDLAQDWNELSESDRLACLAINDVWSNCVAYGRDQSDQFHTFHTIGFLSDELKAVGLKVVDATVAGFDHYRTHSVPVTRLIAKRINENML